MKRLLKKYLKPSQIRKIKTYLGIHKIDEVLWVYDILKKEKDLSKVMIDVGAHHGGSLASFAEDEWVVYAFEPDDDNYNKLISFVKKFKKNVIVEREALSNKEEDEVSFYGSDISQGISGLSAFHETHFENKKVKLTTLTKYITSKEISKIDFLKIDTEGHDLFVLEGFPWDKLMPKVIVCEFEDNKTINLGYDYKDLGKFLKSFGYKVYLSEWYPIKQYGAKHQWKQVNEFPCELHNSKGWGNFVAFKDVNHEVINKVIPFDK